MFCGSRDYHIGDIHTLTKLLGHYNNLNYMEVNDGLRGTLPLLGGGDITDVCVCVRVLFLLNMRVQSLDLPTSMTSPLCPLGLSSTAPLDPSGGLTTEISNESVVSRM